MRSLLVVCVLMALVALTPAPGAPGSANAETISIVASDNAFVWKGGLNDDQSEAEKLEARDDGSGGNTAFTYLRFDVGPLADATITSASLDMYWLSATGNQTAFVCALNDLAIGAGGKTETSWSGNLTYNTRPDGTANLPNANTSDPLASLPFVKGAAPWLASFDLTSALPGLLHADTNNQLTLILYGGSTNKSYFASLANPYGNPVPTLTVTGEGFNPEAVIPEPGTLALLGMALLGVGFYGWRRSRR